MSPTTVPPTVATPPHAPLGAPTPAAVAFPSATPATAPAPRGWVARLDGAARGLAAKVAQLARRAVDAGRRAVTWTGTQIGRVLGTPAWLDPPTVGMMAFLIVLLVVLYVVTRGRAH